MRHPTELAAEPSGSAREVYWFKQLLKNIRERGVRVGTGLRASYGLNDTLIELDRPAGSSAASASGAIRRCSIISTTPTGTNSANYLTTHEYEADGYVISDRVLLVAIPFFLRISVYGGLTLGGFHYEVVSGQIRCSNAPGSATAYVVKSFFPPYVVGQDIYAIQPAGKTDVTVDDALLEWIDANVEGRRLDTMQTQLPFCRLEGGLPVTRNVVVEGGPIF